MDSPLVVIDATVLAITVPLVAFNDRVADVVTAVIAAPFDAVTLSHWIGSELVAFDT